MRETPQLAQPVSVVLKKLVNSFRNDPSGLEERQEKMETARQTLSALS